MSHGGLGSGVNSFSDRLNRVQPRLRVKKPFISSATISSIYTASS